MAKAGSIVSRLLVGTLLIALIWAAGLVIFIGQMPTQENFAQTKVDAAVVLTGGSKRVQHGFLRVATGQAHRVFVTGVNDKSTPSSVINLVRRSVASITDNRVAMGYKARSTIGNAKEAAAWIKKHNIKSIRLVTANYHMPRSLYKFSKVLPDTVSIIPDPVFPDGFDITRWLSDSNSRRLALSEYHKFIASHIQHFFFGL